MSGECFSLSIIAACTVIIIYGLANGNTHVVREAPPGARPTATGGGRVHLTDIMEVTARAGHRTYSRHGRPVDQLMCLDTGGLSRWKLPRVIVARQVGVQSGEPLWDFDVKMPAGWTLGHADVSCEGWDGAGDEWVHPDSCGIEYSVQWVG